MCNSNSARTDPQCNVYLNRQGTLLSDLFYHIETAIDDGSLEEQTHGDILLPRSPTGDELFRSGKEYLSVKIVQEKTTTTYDCPAHPDHITGREIDWLSLRVYTEGELADVIVDLSETGSNAGLLVTGQFESKLQKSGLVGYRSVRVEPERKRDNRRNLDLHVVNFKGRDCERPESIRNAPNACPFCGNAPLVCPVCGFRQNFCSVCGAVTITLDEWHEGPDDPRLTTSKHTKPPFVPPILDGARWDGSDFIYTRRSGAGFVTKRAMDWLITVRAAPLYAKPVVVCIDGMSDEQREWLERAKRPLAS